MNTHKAGYNHLQKKRAHRYVKKHHKDYKHDHQKSAKNSTDEVKATEKVNVDTSFMQLG